MLLLWKVTSFFVSFIHCYSVSIIPYYIHTWWHTHSSQNYSCKSADINEFEHCFEIVKRVLAFACYHDFSYFAMEKNGITLVHKQTNKGDSEYYIEINERPQKSSQTKFSRTKQKSRSFFHHDMRFFPFCLAFISLRAKICLILLFGEVFFSVGRNSAACSSSSFVASTFGFALWWFVIFCTTYGCMSMCARVNVCVR